MTSHKRNVTKMSGKRETATSVPFVFHPIIHFNRSDDAGTTETVAGPLLRHCVGSASRSDRRKRGLKHGGTTIVVVEI